MKIESKLRAGDVDDLNVVGEVDSVFQRSGFRLVPSA